ncbi:hypothetical protein K9M74_04075 [Candidatus Woesearchaeota archaeon]|nr:hypothetical protein [Candidatus Woesearchaeota archaeon]
MSIDKIRKDKKTKELVIEGFWRDYDTRNTIHNIKSFNEMINELKAAEMHPVADGYINELKEIHKNNDDYDQITGKVKPGTQAEFARNYLKDAGIKEHELHNPLHEQHKHIILEQKLNASGEFPTKYAAKLLTKIPGFEKEYDINGHDITLTYKGRKKTLMGGSGQTGQTNKNAVDSVINAMVERDVKLEHIHEENKDKRRDSLKKLLYENN